MRRERVKGQEGRRSSGGERGSREDGMREDDAAMRIDQGRADSLTHSGHSGF